MHEFRVTKYDPANRNELGHFLGSEWTAFSDVGREVTGSVLSLAEYERVEEAYIGSALAFLVEAGVDHLCAVGVENAGASPAAPKEHARLSLRELEAAIRGVLREEFWCRFEGPDAFVHLGWDFYMYVGVPIPCESACAFAEDRGLFVESFESPYRMRSDESEGRQ